MRNQKVAVPGANYFPQSDHLLVFFEKVPCAERRWGEGVSLLETTGEGKKRVVGVRINNFSQLIDKPYGFARALKLCRLRLPRDRGTIRTADMTLNDFFDQLLKEESPVKWRPCAHYDDVSETLFVYFKNKPCSTSFRHPLLSLWHPNESAESREIVGLQIAGFRKLIKHPDGLARQLAKQKKR